MGKEQYHSIALSGEQIQKTAAALEITLNELFAMDVFDDANECLAAAIMAAIVVVTTKSLAAAKREDPPVPQERVLGCIAGLAEAMVQPNSLKVAFSAAVEALKAAEKEDAEAATKKAAEVMEKMKKES